MGIWNNYEPMGLPKGSCRFVLATIIILFCLAFFWVRNSFPTELVGIMGTVLGFYFGARVNEQPENPK